MGRRSTKQEDTSGIDPALFRWLTAELGAAHGEIKRLRAALTEIMAMSEPAGYDERSKAQIRDVARRTLGRHIDG